MSSDQEDRNWFLVLKIIRNHCKSANIVGNQRKSVWVTGNQQKSLGSSDITKNQ